MPRTHTLSIFLGCAFSSIVYATEYQVSNSSELSALPTLQAGDEVILAEGTYAGADLTLNFNGSAEDPVLVYAQPAGGAKFTGGTRIILDGQYGTVAGLNFNGDGGPVQKEGVVKFEEDSRNIVLHNCQFKDFDDEGVSDANWVFIEGYDHTVSFCSFEGKTSMNATIFIKPTEDEETTYLIPRNHLITYCYFGPRTEIGSNGYEAIRISDSARQAYETACIISNNYFYQAISSSNGSEMEVISNKSRKNIYRGNILEDCDGQITLRHGRDCIVEENYIIGTGGSRESGIRVIGTGHIVRNNYIENVDGDGLRSALCIMDGEYGLTTNDYEGVEDTIIDGNVIVECKTSINFGENKGFDDPPRNTTFVNNRIYNSSGDTLFTVQSDAHFLEVSGNEVYASGGLGNTDQLIGGFVVNAEMDLSLPFDSLIDKEKTGHDFDQLFIQDPSSLTLKIPVRLTHTDDQALLSFNATASDYLNVYVSDNLQQWHLYSEPTQAIQTGTQNVQVRYSELPEGVSLDNQCLFFRVVIDSERHVVELPPIEGGAIVENGGLVTVEAEAYTDIEQNSDTVSWSVSTINGEVAMGTSAGSTATWETAATLSYVIQFNTPGTYYIHPRFIAESSSDDSFFFGVNDVQSGQANTGISSAWSWYNNESEAIVIDSPGSYEIQIRRREAGLKLDKFTLTNDPSASY